MNGPDGKPFKTRAGGIMKLYDLIAMAADEAGKRLAEQGLAADYDADERAGIAICKSIASSSVGAALALWVESCALLWVESSLWVESALWGKSSGLLWAESCKL